MGGWAAGQPTGRQSDDILVVYKKNLNPLISNSKVRLNGFIALVAS